MKSLFGLIFLTACTLQPGSGCLVPGQTQSTRLDVEACEHLSGKAAQTLAAALQATDETPWVEAEGRQDVTLPASQAGFVRWDQDETADVVIYLDQAIPISVTDASGKPVTPMETAQASDTFGAIKHKSVYHLDSGPHHVKLGPASVSPIGLVIEEQHEEAGGDHGHAD